MKIFSAPVLIGIITIIVLLGGVYLLSKGSTQTPTPSLTAQNTFDGTSSANLTENYQYYWGIDCPHCANVEKFLESWSNTNKLKIDKKEVFQNQANSLELTQRAKSCNLPVDQIAVPFLYTPDKKCLEGDQPIIDYFTNLKFP